MKKTTTAFLCGAICTAMATGVVSSAIAATQQKTIEVTTGVDFYVDDIKVHPTDANGSPVDVLMYNGTTYLPVRALSKALGQNIAWDGSTMSVFYGKHAADSKPAIPLEKLDYFTSTGLYGIEQKLVTDNLGNTHQSMEIDGRNDRSGNIIYKLNGKYSQLTGTLFLPFGDRSTNGQYTVTFYGDGRQLWSGTVTGGIEPKDFNLNLTGVMELNVEFSSTYSLPRFYLGDTMLYT